MSDKRASGQSDCETFCQVTILNLHRQGSTGGKQSGEIVPEGLGGVHVCLLELAMPEWIF